MKLIPYEIWRDIPGYEGYYQVSTMGNIRSLDGLVEVHRKNSKYYLIRKGKLLTPVIQQHKQHNWIRKDLYVTLGRGNRILVARLTALVFIPNPLGLPQVNHKDENTFNNHVSNLEWCDAKYNCNYGTRNERMAKSKWTKINQYDKCTGKLIKTWSSLKQASYYTGIHASNISFCLTGRYKTSGGFIWKYADD